MGGEGGRVRGGRVRKEGEREVVCACVCEERGRVKR